MTRPSSNIHDQTPQTVTFAGDWHGNYRQAENVLTIANDNDSHHILQAGDFGLWNTADSQMFLSRLNKLAVHFDTHIYFVDGNHEDHPFIQTFPLQEDGTRRIRSNIHHLPRGFRWAWSDVRFLALGGAFSVDRAWRKLGESYFTEEVLSREDIETAINTGVADVMLSHDSPSDAPNPVTDSFRGQIQGLQMFGADAIDQATQHRTLLQQVTDVVDPALIVHGHYHAYGQAPFTRKSTGTRCTVLALDEGSALASDHMMIVPVSELQRIVANSREASSQ